MNKKQAFGLGCMVGGIVATFAMITALFLGFGTLPAFGVKDQSSSLGASIDPTKIRKELGHVNTIKPKELTIIRAQYGAGDATVDVTSLIRDRIKENTLSVSVSNDLAGDPAWGRMKRLNIEYILDGQKKSVSVPESGFIEIPGLAPIDNVEDLLTFVKVCPAEVGFFAMDFTTGKTIEYRPDQPACMASIVKLFTLLEVMSQVQAGQLTLNDPIRIGEKNTTINDALDLMIGISDNAATTALTARIGFDSVNELPGELAMSGISDPILPKPGILDDVLNQRVFGSKVLSGDSLPPQHATARGMVRYFELLKEGKLKSPDISSAVLAVLDRHPRGFVPNAPIGFKVVGKGGSLAWNSFGKPQYNMLGWNVYLRDEKTSLALCVWCEWFPEKMPDELKVKWCSAISDGIVSVLLNDGSQTSATRSGGG